MTGGSQKGSQRETKVLSGEKSPKCMGEVGWVIKYTVNLALNLSMTSKKARARQ